jgi:hypothetical protein
MQVSGQLNAIPFVNARLQRALLRRRIFSRRILKRACKNAEGCFAGMEEFTVASAPSSKAAPKKTQVGLVRGCPVLFETKMKRESSFATH